MITERDFWHWLFAAGVYIQLGSFLEKKLSWGSDHLFWLLWTSWFILIVVIVKLFNCKRVHPDES